MRVAVGILRQVEDEREGWEEEEVGLSVDVEENGLNEEEVIVAEEAVAVL